MTWRTHLGTLAQRVGLDPKAVTESADRLVTEAHKLAATAEKAATAAVEQGIPVAKKLAATAVEHGVPAAKRITAQLQSAAGAVADEIVTRAKAHKPTVPILSTVPITKAAKRETAPEAAQVTETPVSVRTKDAPPFELTGLSITIDDARELARVPKELAADEVLDVEQAKRLRDYVAATPSTIFAARGRIANNTDELTARLGKPPVDPWRSVEEARRRLGAFDKQHGTDYAASSWAAMIRGWNRDDIPASAHDALTGVTQLLRHVGASPRGRAHAADLCDALLTVAHVEGWPTRLFEKDADLDKLFAVVKRAAASPDSQETIARKLFAVAGAMLASPVSAAEHAPGLMHPLGLRAEVALRAVDILDRAGKTSHDGLRDAALKAASSPDAQPTAAELDELGRAPRWLTSPLFAGTDLTSTQAAELVSFVAGSKGDLRERELRLQAFVRTPRIRNEIAAHLALDTRDGALLAAASPFANVQRALTLLDAHDQRAGTCHAVAAAKGLLEGTPRGESARELVAAARTIIATRGTAEDKRFLLEHIHGLVERSAWPSLRTQNGVDATLTLIADATELAKNDAVFANSLFVIGYKLASTALPEAGTSDDAERAVIAGAIAKVGTTLQREQDAAMFGFLERQLKGETSSS